jgi:hypothetical protein
VTALWNEEERTIFLRESIFSEEIESTEESLATMCVALLSVELAF